VLQRQGRNELALKEFDVAVECSPTSAPCHYRRGVAYLIAGQSGTAKEAFSAAIKHDPKCAEAYYGRALVARGARDWDGELADLDNALFLDPNFPEAHLERGCLFEQLGLWSQAIAPLDNAIRLRQDYPKAYCQRAYANLQLHDMRQAISDCDQAIKLNADLERRQLDQAIRDRDNPSRDGDRLVELNASLARPHCIRGVAKTDRGLLDEALADFETAKDLTPNDGRAFYNLGVVYHRKGELVKAIGMYIRASEMHYRGIPDRSLNPEHADTYFNLGLAYQTLAREGRPTAPDPLLKSFFRENPDRTLAPSEPDWKIGSPKRIPENNWDAARAWFEQVLQIKPGDPDAQKHIAAIDEHGINAR
jgi:tetratricopeptide (TPR) repeat protein